LHDASHKYLFKSVGDVAARTLIARLENFAPYGAVKSSDPFKKQNFLRDEMLAGDEHRHPHE
jgi:hypothetical protein